MPPLQFQPLQSQPTPEFWSALAALKLDSLRLDDTIIPVYASIDEARQVASSNAHTSPHDGTVGVDGSVLLSSTSFEAPEGNHTTIVKGHFKNFNTIEQFRSPQSKKEILEAVAEEMLLSFHTERPILNTFVLFAFADLKKYIYHYWFAFPAFVSKPTWQVEQAFHAAEEEDVEECRGFLDREHGVANDTGFLLIKGPRGHRQSAPLRDARRFFNESETKERLLVFHDPSALPDNPGWPLRNALYYLQSRQSITSVAVLCIRQGRMSRIGRVCVDGPMDPSTRPSVVGWERDRTGKLASRVADLGPMLDPRRLAEQAVDLNLKLMRWRILPDLQLDRMASTRCLLLGAGTLGCYVARALMGWGVRNITFVDSARVSFSNPVRQPLFRFEDCLDGGRPKAACAAERLKEIYPSVNAGGHAMLIPMPGHPVGTGSASSDARENVAALERLVADHDVVFLLMDSRESRWLPTLIAAAQGKLVINAALGFDSFLVMRHGAGPRFSTTSRRLGCYFCNDIVAPVDSLTDRTLDQMCTVTRPGLAPIAAANAVELLATMSQHTLWLDAPAERPGDDTTRTTHSTLGPAPHQIRGSLSQWNTSIVEGYAFDRCTACSPTVVNAFEREGIQFLLRVFNEEGYLAKVTGLDKLYEEAEAALDSVDWDDDDEDGL